MITTIPIESPRARIVWRCGQRVHVSFPTLPRAFEAIFRLTDAGRPAQYRVFSDGRHWISFDCQQVMPFALV